MTSPPDIKTFVVEEQGVGVRLDKFLSGQINDISRSQIQTLIDQEKVEINDKVETSRRYKLPPGALIKVTVDLPEQEESWHPVQGPLNILYQDDDYLVLNKPAGLVTHPSAGHWEDSLLQRVAFAFEQVNVLPRSGMVHRLDQDTTGAIVFALNSAALIDLKEQLNRREISRQYLAIVKGVPLTGMMIDLPIGRHRISRKKMAVEAMGKPAVTHISVTEKYRYHAKLKATLETGRTHQIRVHLSTKGFPVLGDPTYGGIQQPIKGIEPAFLKEVCSWKRQALHAERLQFEHIRGDKRVDVLAPLPHDLQTLIFFLEAQKH